jgi:membrane protease YdiL (CAAX protease family)
VWDTVSTVIVPRPDRFYLPSLQTLPFTRTNPSVETFRHAIAMDERRRMFRLNHWKDDKGSVPDPETGAVRTRQTWFAGVHSDVGGGYPEAESALSKYPLLWMIAQARDLPEGEALRFDERLVDWLARGRRPEDGDPRYPYVAPDPKGPLHESLTGAWWLFEPLPKSARLKEWPGRLSLLGLYIPWAEPRPIPNRPLKGVPSHEPFAIHSSAVARVAEAAAYRPVNLPGRFTIDSTEGPAPPVVPAPPYLPEGALARLRRLISTWPDGAGWASLGRTALWLLPALLLLGWLGGFIGWDPNLTPELALLAAIAVLVPVLAEESLFRAILLKPPSDGASGLGPALLSASLFALYNFAAALLCPVVLGEQCPPWADLGLDPWFLAATFALGLACARLALATRSIWPGAVLHWAVLMGWLALFGGPRLVGG